MNGLLRDLLSERADAAGAPDLDLQDLITHGERRVTRRRRVVLGGTAAAVVLTVGASFALLQGGDRTTSPDLPPTTDSPSTDVAPDPTGTDGKRPLTYGVDGTIHYGDRVIEAAEDADGLFLVDGGLAFLTGGHGRTSETRLYFTDGGEPVEIARGVERVTSGDVGSLLVWLDGDDVVIYDAGTRSEVDRLPLNGRLLSNPITPLEDAVYWHGYREDTATSRGRDFFVRYDVATGTRTRATQPDYRADTRTTPIIVMGSADSTNPPTDFSVVDSHIGVDTSSELGDGPAFVAATGEPLRVKVPDEYEDQSLYLFQWLDDDRFALVAIGGLKGAPVGDLLTCRISAGQCQTVATGEQDWLLPGANGGVGSED